MEGVEDIPGTALHEGIDWDWESFPEYLDALDKTPRAIDIAAQVPHAALRAYVMGERAHEREATADEIAEMSKLAEEACGPAPAASAPAARSCTARKHGLVPGTDAPPEELLALGEAIGRAGHGVFQLVSDHQGGAGDRAWLVDLVERTGATATYTLAQARLRAATPGATRSPPAPRTGPPAAGSSRRCRAGPPGCSSASSRRCTRSSPTPPTAPSPTCRSPSASPGSRSPRCGPRCSPRSRGTRNPIALGLMQRWDQIFPLGDPPDYEPPRSASVAGVAEREGRSPQEVVLDWLLERDGTAFLFAPLASYVDHDHEALREMMTDPNTVLGLSDGGAHCGLICDVSMPTYLLTHWVNGRERGPAPRPRAGHQPADVAHRRRLRLHRPRRARRRASGPTSTSSTSTPCTSARPRWCSTSPPAAAASSSAPTATSPRSSPARSPIEHGEPTGARPGRLVRF